MGVKPSEQRRTADFYREIRTVVCEGGGGTGGGRDETTQQICFMFRKRLRVRAEAVITPALLSGNIGTVVRGGCVTF